MEEAGYLGDDLWKTLETIISLGTFFLVSMNGIVAPVYSRL